MLLTAAERAKRYGEKDSHKTDEDRLNENTKIVHPHFDNDSF
jgi:hypothetical protein